MYRHTSVNSLQQCCGSVHRMRYYLDLFSPETYEAFSQSDRTVSGFRLRQRRQADRIRPGDRFLCYMTKLLDEYTDNAE